MSTWSLSNVFDVSIHNSKPFRISVSRGPSSPKLRYRNVHLFPRNRGSFDKLRMIQLLKRYSYVGGIFLLL